MNFHVPTSIIVIPDVYVQLYILLTFEIETGATQSRELGANIVSLLRNCFQVTVDKGKIALN